MPNVYTSSQGNDFPRAPLTSDDSSQGFGVGFFWYDTATKTTYRCTDNTYNAAVWIAVAESGVDAAKTATGTTIADGFAITKGLTQFTTVASGTGANLPASNGWSRRITVRNDGANPLKVYPASGVSGTINGGSANASVNLAAGEVATYLDKNGSDDWLQVG